ncbi:hypothetical protein [Cucumibacter marinus]|uniref:hypothetical protein n=1 Tax=Cucumibacter marinus TaxID=1121252 RepID=UPI00041FC5EE|nr:hypothetical protein [Cucumibacter marinus]
MRRPLWLFLVVFLVPPTALHASLSGKAAIVEQEPAMEETAALKHVSWTVDEPDLHIL